MDFKVKVELPKLLVVWSAAGNPPKTPRDWSPRISVYKERLKSFYDSLPDRVKVPQTSDSPEVAALLEAGIGFIVKIECGMRHLVYFDAAGDLQIPAEVQILHKECVEARAQRFRDIVEALRKI